MSSKVRKIYRFFIFFGDIIGNHFKKSELRIIYFVILRFIRIIKQLNDGRK